MKKRIILPIIAVIAAVILFGGCFYTTQPNEYTIVRQFGAVVKVVDEPGLSMKLPFIQSVSTLPKTEMLYDLAVSDVITSDKKSMVADSFVLWRIDDPLLFIKTLSGNIANAEYRIDTIVYNSLKTVISSMKQENVISGRDGLLAQKIMVSERGNIAASFSAEGEAEAKQIRNEADKTVQITLSEANAMAEKLKAEGEAEYMRILSEVYDTPAEADFYEFMRALDMARNSIKDGEKTLVVSSDSPIARVFSALS